MDVNYTIVGSNQFSNLKTKTNFIEDDITNGRYAFEADIPDLLSGVDLPSDFVGRFIAEVLKFMKAIYNLNSTKKFNQIKSQGKTSLKVSTKVSTSDGRSEEEINDGTIVWYFKFFELIISGRY